MKQKQNQKSTIFKAGVASSAIDEIVQNIPNIMFVCGLLLRLCIGILLFMHSITLFSFIKDLKVRQFISFVSVTALEVVFTTFSLASANIRKQGFEIAINNPKKGAELNNWANAFFFFTLVGSLLFNGFVIYYIFHTGATIYFNKIDKANFWETFIYIESLNVFALIISEGSAFILNANIEKNKP